ncbi:MAG: DUF4867 family protein [Clostridia bacterium]|nr:DUF4867 family protein [Clostridia bacterium]
MIEKLKKLNPDLDIYSVRDEEFNKYGKLLSIDTSEMIGTCLGLDFPREKSEYIPSVDALEKSDISDDLRMIMFGGCPTQIGITHGYNRFLNGLEYHKCSEINVAATPLCLILGLQYEMEGKEYDSSRAKVFFLEKGDAVEIYSTTLHFCPCQVSDEGFSCVVVLAEGTNTLLDAPSEDKLLFKKNKWIICHDENLELIERGVYPGIHGINYEIKY